MKIKSICVFCGSNKGAHPSYLKAANELGELLAEFGIRLIFGGGRVGLMGVVADAVMKNGGEVIGIIPNALDAREVGHSAITELRIVSSMHERKAAMADLADAFIALPGGFGTFEEFCEILTWAQLGIHQKPCGLLNVNNYYDSLLNLFDHATNEQFVREEHRKLVLVHNDPKELIDLLNTYEPPVVEKWLDLPQS
jgi:uncharacterized protein (TIGR00730 family)